MSLLDEGMRVSRGEQKEEKRGIEKEAVEEEEEEVVGGGGEI